MLRRTMSVSVAALGVAVFVSGASPAAAAGKPQQTPPRTAFTAGDLASAKPVGLRERVRVDGDDATAFRTLLAGGARTGDPWLVISGGGENGAYAAGLLDGWSQRGDRPSFGVVTGVSTGALIAPFAFVGREGDAALKHAYTKTTAADVFEFGGTKDALLDTWPLKRGIERSVTPELLARVAAAQSEGRRLLIVTTEVDSGRPVLWDMGAIAAEGSPAALKLFREVMLASASIPALFPPVLIDATDGQGRAIQEMHADGGTTAPFFIAPASVLDGTAAPALPTRKVYLVVNTRAAPDFDMAERTVMSVLGRSMSAMIRAQTDAALLIAGGYAARSGLDLEVARLDGGFARRSPGPFDSGYMRALFAYASDLARDGKVFGAAPAVASHPREPDATGGVRATAPTEVAQRAVAP